MTLSPHSFSIRPFHPADRESLQQFWHRAFPDDPPWNDPALIIQNKLTVQPELLLVGELDEIIIGTVIAGFDGMRGWIHHLAVAPAYRRRGFATRLLHAAEAGLRRLGCPKINLQIRANNPQVIAFYKHAGYEIEDRISMGRLLTATR
jgi:ribosomal protein S18 acetylase RimI-like enzyme